MAFRRKSIRARRSSRRTSRRPAHNPPKQLRRRRAARRAPRRNPPKSGQKGYKTPESVRRKISLAVKRAQAARSGGVRNKVRSIFRKGTTSRRRAGGSRGRRNLLSFMKGGSEIKRLFSAPTVKLAVGAVGAGFVTSIIVNRFGQHLPGIASPVGRVGYRLGIPLLAAAVTRKFDHNLANGMVIGAAVSGVNEIIRIIAGSPATVPVLANRAVPNQAGLVGAGGRGSSLSGYVGYEGSEEDFEAYSGEEEEFDGFAEGGDEWS